MGQPISGDQWTTISGVGSVVVANRNATFKRVVIPGTYVGTVAFYNSDTVAGTTAAKNFLTVGLPATSTPQSFKVNANCSEGIVYAASGTPTLTITWD